MYQIDYELRNKRYSNSKYDLQRLVGEKYLGMDYRVSDTDKRMYKDVEAYEVFLKWEGFVMSFIAPGPEDIPQLLKMNKYIGYRLNDWDSMPNHACQAFKLFFEGAEDADGVVFNVYYYVKWEVAS